MQESFASVLNCEKRRTSCPVCRKLDGTNAQDVDDSKGVIRTHSTSTLSPLQEHIGTQCGAYSTQEKLSLIRVQFKHTSYSTCVVF
jgi:hypothetical protein